MTGRLLSAALSLVVLVLAPRGARADLAVVATVPSLAAIAKEIGAGGKVSVTSLALPTQDPHFVDAKPSLVLDLSKADLLLSVGLGLEAGWLPVLQNGARNPNIVPGAKGYLDCAQIVKVLDQAAAPADRSQGDIHPMGSPHYLFDPRAAVDVAKGVAARMAELDAAHKDAYQAGLEAFVQKLGAARAGWEKRLAPRRGAPIVAYHRSWAYLSDWLGLRPVEYLEPKPGVPPSPAHVAKVLVAARASGVKVILQESFYPDATGRLVAEKAGARLVVLPAGADARAGQSYLDHMEQVVTRIEEAFAR